MKSLNSTGAYTVESDVLAKISESFVGYYTDEAATSAEIKANFEKLGYLHDTHTSVAVNAARQYEADTGDSKPTVIASTASPYKFAADVLVSLGGHRPTDDLEALDKLSELTKTEITAPLRGLGERPVRFTETIDPADMPTAVKNYTK
jgi:threonine synthase